MAEQIDFQQDQTHMLVDEPKPEPSEKETRRETTNMTPTETKLMSIPLSRIDPFPEHPFQIRDDTEMENLVESIGEHGVLTPVIVRAKEGKRYELVSGHRRKRACELAGIESMPVIIQQMTDEEAVIVMCDSNLQREKVLPSEKAYAYKMKLDALKRQGRRSDLTSRPVVEKSDSANKVGADAGESGRQIQRYIRLIELIPPLLQMVDEGHIAFRPAVELSYLPKKNQRELVAAIERELCTPSLAQSLKLKQFAQEGKLTSEVITSIMQEQKANQKEQVRIPRESIAKFFKKDAGLQAITDTIVKALELYRRRERSRDTAR